MDNCARLRLRCVAFNMLATMLYLETACPKRSPKEENRDEQKKVRAPVPSLFHLFASFDSGHVQGGWPGSFVSGDAAQTMREAILGQAMKSALQRVESILHQDIPRRIDLELVTSCFRV